ncbi:hypothetical protein LCGC14_2583740, partial [marine sediment metagenome]
ARFAFGWQKWGIRSKDLVLEIGSGERPNARSDILCDKYLWDDTERAGPLVIDRPFIVGNGVKLPFRDNIFDFVLCSHLVEHIADPGKFFMEMMRVGARGCIIAPTELYESLVGSANHRWIISIKDNCLLLKKKKTPWLVPALNSFAHSVKDRKPVEHFIDQYHPSFFLYYHWKGQINYQLDPPIQRRENCQFLEAHLNVAPQSNMRTNQTLKRYCQSVISRVIRQYWSRKIKPRLTEIIACPVCKGNVCYGDSETTLICDVCGRRFPIENGIPLLLEELAK